MPTYVFILNRTVCGAIVEVRLSDPDNFKLRDPTNKHRSVYLSDATFNPGQTLIGCVGSLTNEKWLTPKPKYRSTQRISVRFFFEILEFF